MVKKTFIMVTFGGLLFLGCPHFLFGQEVLTVQRVVDGDTLKLSNGERVRLIGVDTPESADNPKLRRDSKRTGQDRAEIIKMGKEAAEFTRKLVEGKRVRLAYDVQRKDRYGRTLAYVFIPTKIPKGALIKRTAEDVNDYTDGAENKEIFVNGTVVGAGYAQVMTIPPNVKYASEFLELQKWARKDKRGLWKE